MLTTEDIDDLWEKMAAAYGHRWVANFGASDNGTWYELLKDLTPVDLERGRQRCLALPEHADRPPNAPQFRLICRSLIPAEKPKPKPAFVPNYDGPGYQRFRQWWATHARR